MTGMLALGTDAETRVALPLPVYEAACRAVAEARTVDEVKSFRDKAEAMRAYARQAKNKQLEIDACEIRIRAERRIGELMQQQKDAGLLHRGGGDKKSDHRVRNGPGDPPTLLEAGIDKHLADRARKLAAVPQAEFDAKVSNWRGRVEAETERVTADLLQSGEKHVRGTFGTGENEWYTPAEHIAMARDVMGAIDLDPATTEDANEIVGATRIFTTEDDGLAHEWCGRVWLNPPYAQPFISHFAEKLVAENAAGRIEQAIALTHNYTDTQWFQTLARASSAICFPRGRIRFVSPAGELAAPTQGQAFFYFGEDSARFAGVFSRIGFVVSRCE